MMPGAESQNVTPNHRVNRTAEQLRCSVPASLRAAAAGYPERSQTKTATPMATGHYKRNTGCLYSRENLLVCGAQFARTHNTLVFMRTRKPRSVERQKKPPAGFGFLLQWAESSLAALFVRERLIRTDTAHCVSGFAPFGGAAQFER